MNTFLVMVTCAYVSSCPLTSPFKIKVSAMDDRACHQMVWDRIAALHLKRKQFVVKCSKE